MFAPNQTTYDLADHTHHERQRHASLVAMAKHEREDNPVPRETHRRVTARRLTAAAVGTFLSVAIAAGVVAVQGPSTGAPDQPTGGGLTLKR